jgi:hypothetical protein
MGLTPPVDALVWVDQCIEEARESLGHLSDALGYLCLDAEADDLPGGRLPAETEHLFLAEQRRCQHAAALLERIQSHVAPELRRRRACLVSKRPAGVPS